MNRIGMTWRIDPAQWDAYKEIHLNPWPELIAAIQEVGIHNYSIFALPDPQSQTHGTRVFAYMEVDGDVGEAMARLTDTDIKRRWDVEVTVAVLPEAVNGSGVQFMQMEPIFYCP